MDKELGTRYYRLALSAAVQRKLSSAVQYARYACLFDGDHEDAAKLLDLCRYELGEQAEGESADDGFGLQAAQAAGTIPPLQNEAAGLAAVRALVEKKKYRDAAKAARAIPHQSVRLLNIQGCLWAALKDHIKAADYFARALTGDQDNRLAALCLVDLVQRPRPFWQNLGDRVGKIWGTVYEKPL
jgi:tetratricopeptide (TPR) repeat protein